MENMYERSEIAKEFLIALLKNPGSWDHSTDTALEETVNKAFKLSGMFLKKRNEVSQND